MFGQKGSSSKCLGVVGGNFYNGAEVDIYDCNDSYSQKWFMYNGTTQVSTTFGNYCLDAGVPPFDNNRVLTIWECYKDLPQQTWDWSENGATVTLHDQGKCLDLTNGSKDNGNLVQIYDCYPGNTNQMWTHTNIVTSDPTGGNTTCQYPNGYCCPGIPPPDSTTTWSEKNGDQSKCLGVVGGNMYNGAQVDIYDCNDSDSQKWFMGNGLTPVSTAFGNYCLDAGLPPFDNNRVLTIWECNKDLPQQQWYRSDDYGTVALNGQRKCMDLTNGSKDNRNLIQIYDCYDGNTNQMW
ncbi:ricin B lectin domain-containing protein, partial [Flagelloscypha sp. PMI_526]